MVFVGRPREAKTARGRKTTGGWGSIERWSDGRFHARGGCVRLDKLLLKLLHSDLRRRVLSSRDWSQKLGVDTGAAAAAMASRELG